MARFRRLNVPDVHLFLINLCLKRLMTGWKSLDSDVKDDAMRQITCPLALAFFEPVSTTTSAGQDSAALAGVRGLGRRRVYE